MLLAAPRWLTAGRVGCGSVLGTMDAASVTQAQATSIFGSESSSRCGGSPSWLLAAKAGTGEVKERTLMRLGCFVGYRGPDGEGERQGKLPVRGGGGGGAGFVLRR